MNLNWEVYILLQTTETRKELILYEEAPRDMHPVLKDTDGAGNIGVDAFAGME